ncbi:MAG: diaminopimelate decarboxylase [Firmicutes bacterium]|nr:diaminopimelate decarboxylase [Bacillota bacterium]
MILRGTMRRNEKGHLEIGGCDAVELTRRFGPPLYVLDEEDVRARCRASRAAMAEYAPGGMVTYAGKALLCTAMCRLMDEEGLGLDVVSGGELYTALSADFPAERLIFHGNNKSPAELEAALRAGVGLIVVDNEVELAILIELARAMAKRPRILLRLTPGVEAHTHHYIRTGQQDSKFGLDIQNGQARRAVRQVLAAETLALVGFHCHIGSQILDLEGFVLAARIMMDFALAMREEYGFVAEIIDLGGGLGIRYTAADQPPSIDDYMRAIAGVIATVAEGADYPRPRLIVEPGRSIVGEAGVTLYTVGTSKEVSGIRRYVAVDGGMAANPRVALYQAVYEATLAERAGEEGRDVVTIAGKCCESGDILIWDAPLPTPKFGEILAVFSTGAYNYSMASNYNRLPRPALVSCYRGEADLFVARETYPDLLRQDRFPSRLRRVTAAAAGIN